MVALCQIFLLGYGMVAIIAPQKVMKKEILEDKTKLRRWRILLVIVTIIDILSFVVKF